MSSNLSSHRKQHRPPASTTFPFPLCLTKITSLPVSLSVAIGAAVGSVAFLIVLFALYRRKHGPHRTLRLFDPDESKAMAMTDNPMHVTYDVRRLRTSFLFDETNVDEPNDLKYDSLGGYQAHRADSVSAYATLQSHDITVSAKASHYAFLNHTDVTQPTDVTQLTDVTPPTDVSPPG